MAASKAIQVAHHPSRGSSTILIVMGAVLGSLGALMMAVGVIGAALFFCGLGASVLAFGVWVRRIGWGAQIGNMAMAAVSEGRLADAESLLETAEASRPGPYIARFVDLQRAVVRLRRGRLEQAVERATAALERPIGILQRWSARTHAAEARAIRALASAALDHPDAARADIAVLRADPYALPGSIARAGLAEAVVLERSGDRAALRAHLASKRFVLLEHAAPRERAVVRAYQRMLRVPITTPYREAVPASERHPDNDEPDLGDWVATMAPGAARFVRAGAAPPAPQPRAKEVIAPAARIAAEKRFGGGGSGAARVFGLWAVLIVMFISAWTLFSPARESHRDAPAVAPQLWSGWSWLVPMLFLVGVAAAYVVLRKRIERRVLEAQGLLARGDMSGARSAYQGLQRSPFALVAAQGALGVAGLASRSSDFAASLAASELGIAKARRTRAARVAASDFQLPALHSVHAEALASVGRGEEAEAEMAIVAETFPVYPHLASSRYAVSLVDAARRGDVAEAARVASTATDGLALSVRGELLGALAMAARYPQRASAAEIGRLREELRLDAESRRWVQAVGPAVLSAFEAAHGQDDGDGDGEDRARPDAQAGGETPPDEGEREARAELEAEAALGGARRVRPGAR
ncbi:MAG: hypothetical protein WKG00_23105 [Polyangiaceae bacterium]